MTVSVDFLRGRMENFHSHLCTSLTRALSDSERQGVLGDLSRHASLLYCLLRESLGDDEARLVAPLLFSVNFNSAVREAHRAAWRRVAIKS